MTRSDVVGQLEAAMLAERIEYVPMSFEDYLELPREVRAEWVDGVAIVSPHARVMHQVAVMKLAMMLGSSLHDVTVLPEPNLRTAERRYRIPDIVVLDQADVEDVLFCEAEPVLVVEVLSPATRGEDLVRKSPEYFAAGVGQYWVLDRDEPSLLIYRRDADSWDFELALDADQPTGSVTVGEYGTVELDLAALIAV